MQEGTVIEWPFEIGAPVAKGDVVLIIESEKAEVEIEATGHGYFRHIYVETDEVVPCGTVLAALTERIGVHGGKFAELLADESGVPRSTLLVALNDEQVASDAYESTTLSDGANLMLMTPIAGG